MRSDALLQLLNGWIADWGDLYPDGRDLAVPFRDWLTANAVADQEAALRAFQEALTSALTWNAAVADAAARVVDPPQKRAALAWATTFARDAITDADDFNSVLLGIIIFQL